MRAIKSKVIVVLILALLALVLALAVSKAVFNKMLANVDEISAPSEKLRIVNVISRKVGALDQMQKDEVFNGVEGFRKGSGESRALRQLLDSLASTYSGDALQIQRITSMKRLLNERDRQFENYLSVREKFIKGKPITEQVKKITGAMAERTMLGDSTVVATEEKTTTTTVFPEKEKPRGFFNKIFGRKKDPEDALKIVSQEKVKRDTISVSADEQLARNLEQSLKIIEAEQQKKNQRLLSREALLAEANSNLIKQMQQVLRKVEADVLKQIERTGDKARGVVRQGVSTISMIIIVFVGLTGLLVVFILTDISRSGRYRIALEKAKEEAEYYGQAKQRFLSNMSHEIRTPLQSIIGYAELIKDQAQPRGRDIEAILHSSAHLLQIVNEVLDYNRIVSGKFSFSSEPFNMLDLLNEVVAVMKPQAERKKLKMSARFELDLQEEVMGDPFRLKQILYNLLGNAIKFTDQGSITVTCACKRNSDQLHFSFSVEDTGRGMSDAQRDRIFHEFEQAYTQAPRAGYTEGTGLGLAIVKALVEGQGGRIYVKSTLHEGSLFTVYLSFSKVSEKDTKVRQKNNRQKRVTGKVWIIDDDPLILELCEIFCRRNGIPYQSFGTAEQVLALPWDPSVQSIFMDIRMPGMGGLELCEKIRERSGSALNILAITAQVLPDERAYLLANGFDGILMKPFRERDLLEALSKDFENEVSLDRRAEFPDFDLSQLRAMTYGDEEQLQKVLSNFRKENREDVRSLRAAIEADDRDTVCLLVHRLAGRLAQMGAKDLAYAFRKSEMLLRSKAHFDQKDLEDLGRLLDQLNELSHSIA